MTDPATYRKYAEAVPRDGCNRKNDRRLLLEHADVGLNWPRRLNAIQLAKLSHHQ